MTIALPQGWALVDDDTVAPVLYHDGVPDGYRLLVGGPYESGDVEIFEEQLRILTNVPFAVLAYLVDAHRAKAEAIPPDSGPLRITWFDEEVK